MPLDCIKTELQVRGPSAVPLIRERVKKDGIATFWRGTVATMLATAVGHYPWFAVRNLMDSLAEAHVRPLLGTAPLAVLVLLVDAAVGFTASVASDTVTNSIRQVKTRVQTSDDGAGYAATVRHIIKEGGWSSLFLNGLGTKAFTSALNGLIFNVVLKNFR